MFTVSHTASSVAACYIIIIMIIKLFISNQVVSPFNTIANNYYNTIGSATGIQDYNPQVTFSWNFFCDSNGSGSPAIHPENSKC